jgi:hypothetical protein
MLVDIEMPHGRPISPERAGDARLARVPIIAITAHRRQASELRQRDRSQPLPGKPYQEDDLLKKSPGIWANAKCGLKDPRAMRWAAKLCEAPRRGLQ